MFKKGDKFRVLRGGPSPSSTGQIETVGAVLDNGPGKTLIIPNWSMGGVTWAYSIDDIELVEED